MNAVPRRGLQDYGTTNSIHRPARLYFGITILTCVSPLSCVAAGDPYFHMSANESPSFNST